MERNRIKNVNEFIRVLESNGVKYGKRVVENMIDRLFDNKKSLLNILEKFDTFDSENLRMSRTIIFHNEPDYLNARYMLQSIMDIFHLINWESDTRLEHVNLLYALDTDTINDKLLELFEKCGVKCAIGQKVTRVINKMFADRIKTLDECNTRRFNQFYANLCDYMKRKDTEYTVYFSVNPTDYITMSHGNSWSSCHSLKNMGCHVGGCLSLMLDDCTIIAYASTEDYIGADKIFRLCLNHFHNVSMVSTIYGGVDYEIFRRRIFDEWKKMLEEIGNTILNESPNENHQYYRFEENSDNRAYPDYIYNNQLCWYLNEYNNSCQYYYIGGSANCLVCGDSMDDCENVVCYSCNNCAKCYNCCCTHDRYDMYWIDEEWYCPDCVVECEECGDMIIDGRQYELDGENYCRYCYNKYCETCPDCGDEYHRENMTFDDETEKYYCYDCYDSLIEEREENYRKFCEENPDEDEDEDIAI